MPRKPPPRKKSSPKPPPAGDRRLKALEAENRDLKARLAKRATGGGLPVMEVIQQFNTLDLERISEIATRVIPALAGARLCSLFLYDYETHELVLSSHTHSKPLPERVALKLHKNSVMERALTDRKSINVHGFDAYEQAQGVRLERAFPERYESETCLSVPLLTANFVVGVLNLADRRDGSPFDPDREVPAVEHVGGVLAMAIRNCKLFREVQNQAHTDGLTQLRNYRAFHESLRTEMHRSQRYTRPLGLIMLDIDSFKELNDRHGHQAGDVALVDLGKVIRATLRREDLAARYGGDEIAIVLPETSGTGCKAVVRRLMNAVREHKFIHDGKRLPVSISAGLAFFAADMTITQFVGAADQALYKAKQGGKNRSEVAE